MNAGELSPRAEDRLPSSTGPVSGQVRRLYGDGVDPGIELDSDEIRRREAAAAKESRDGTARSSLELIRRLAREGSGRYELREEIARGGMGAVLKVWDPDLRRHLAMKVILGHDGDVAEPPQALELHQVARFLEEAQITGQLDHPGVVPVHELGLDSAGRLYFTMRLVKGRDLKDIFELVRDGMEGWTLTRALGVLLKVCEAMAYAHAKGVIHRDLKPSNIMVGRFGEVYVMDWGLARVLGRPDPRDLRLLAEKDVPISVVHTDREEEREKTPRSPVVTVDGVVIGTPSYMPPEQAMGRIEELGPRSDVYSVGAMLYHLLAGHMPYVPSDSKTPPYAVLNMLLHGPPKPLRQVNPQAPDELAAICEKAMARDPAQRYADILEMARDVEAFLDRRPVAAHPPSLSYALRLAVLRNKGVSVVSSVATLLLLGAGLVFVNGIAAERDRADHLADVNAAGSLFERESSLYPLIPGEVEARMDQWLAEAERLLAGAEQFRRELGRCQASGEAQRAQEMRSILDALPPLARVRQRVQRNRELLQSDIPRLDQESAALWRQVIEDVATAEAYGAHGELRMRPVPGVVPLRRNDDSGLWEFWVVASGERPVLRPGARDYALTKDSGIVLVLIPGAKLSQARGDLHALPGGGYEVTYGDERELNVDAFFLGRYEVTQAQWARIMGTQPAHFAAGTVSAGYAFTSLHPVESVSWEDSREFARRLGLTLPTAVQWDYACMRPASGQQKWSWGDVPDCLRGKENIADAAARDFAPQGTEEWDDGFRFHAPVGSFRPNASGLYDMHGNVGEWFRDWYMPSPPAFPGPPGDCANPVQEGRQKCYTYACWSMPATLCAYGLAQRDPPRTLNYSRGLRVSRPVER
ncbi:MAG: hypothetical protein EYC70_01650 [Planctomycetota bacterium]|nr:MAG: hypothetical protein EYC70_01650 [Planctomycetota bacterium]